MSSRSLLGPKLTPPRASTSWPKQPGHLIRVQSTQQNTRNLKRKPRPKPVYFDPANKTLDLTLPNRALWKQITADAASRMKLRYKQPAQNWSARFQHKDPKIPLQNLDLLSQELHQQILQSSVSPDAVVAPLARGDVALVGENNEAELKLVVAAPTALTSDKFTFVNHAGEISHGSRHSVQWRVPGAVSLDTMDALAPVVRETKHLGIAPVGIPDAEFLRAAASLPEKLRRNRQESSANVEHGHFSTAGDSFIVAQAAAQLLTDTDVNTWTVPTAARAVFGNLLAELGTRISREIPEMRRRLKAVYGELVRERIGACGGSGAAAAALDSSFSISVFELLERAHQVKLPEISKNRTPWAQEIALKESQVLDKARAEMCAASLIQKVVSEAKDESADQALGSADEVGDFSELHALASPTKHGWESSTLGRPLRASRSQPLGTFPSTSYIALLIGLSASPRRWKVNVLALSKSPVSVEVIPASKSLRIQKAIEYLASKGLKEFVNWFMASEKGDSRLCSSANVTLVLDLLKDHVAGNCDDLQTHSVVGSLLRGIDQALLSKGLPFRPVFAQRHEYSKSRAHEVITEAEKTFCVNPARWSTSLKLPGWGASPQADRDQAFFKLVDISFPDSKSLAAALGNVEQIEDNVLQKESCAQLSPVSLPDDLARSEFLSSDPLASIRADFGNVPVYCIDLATAHEIDDGIAFQTTPQLYIITVHVANPTVYLKQDLLVSQIAYERGTTTYLPEGPTMMLPDIVAKIAGLNGEQKTPTFAVEFSVPRGAADKYMSKAAKDSCLKPSEQSSDEILACLRDSVKVKFYSVSNFPKNFTYERVNDVLNDAKNINKFSDGLLAESSHESNLFKLFHISSILSHIRLRNGNALDFGSGQAKVNVEYSDLQDPEGFFEKTKDGFRISLPSHDSLKSAVISVSHNVAQNSESKSQQLVSNFMIFANHLGALYASKNKINIIHRTQGLKLEPQLEQHLRALRKSLYEDNAKISVEQKAQILSFLTSANFEVPPKKHESLGLDQYANLTSPLRRFVDMVNHWQFQQHALELNGLGEVANWSLPLHDLELAASHLQSRDLINKTNQRASDAFWQLTFLKHYFEMKSDGKIDDPIEFALLPTLDPKFGDVHAQLMDFPLVKCTMVKTEALTDLFSERKLLVGQVTSVDFTVVTLDAVENDFVIEVN